MTTPQRAQYARRWYLANREVVIERAKRWRLAHLHDARQYEREYSRKRRLKEKEELA